jgi:hypothetical protein
VRLEHIGADQHCFTLASSPSLPRNHAGLGLHAGINQFAIGPKC